MSPRLLIVDDQDDIRLMLQLHLEAEGWDTAQAPSGRDALALTSRDMSFDALVLDYKMPGIDGMEVARRLREEGVTRPIIICSAYLNPDLERAARALGVETAPKSDLSRLVETVRRAIGG